MSSSSGSKRDPVAFAIKGIARNAGLIEREKREVAREASEMRGHGRSGNRPVGHLLASSKQPFPIGFEIDCSRLLKPIRLHLPPLHP
jgi:hypothetical protein